MDNSLRVGPCRVGSQDLRAKLPPQEQCTPDGRGAEQRGLETREAFQGRVRGSPVQGGWTGL